MDRPLPVIAGEITALAADIESATCRWLVLVAEFDRREGWAAEGCRSSAQWISWKCGFGPEAARERVRIARRLVELPLVCEAFARAELTYSKVRALTRVESIEREEELVELARTTTAAQLEQLVGAYRGVVRVEQGAAEALAERFVDWSVDVDGSYVIRGRLPAEHGAVLVKAIEAIRDELTENVSAETPAASDSTEVVEARTESVGARNADALAQIADQALATREAERMGGDRFQVVVHVDAAALSADDEAAVCELEHGTPLARETARRLSCDASIVRILEKDGRPLSVGRKTRSIPPALRRALSSRDRGCQFPGCTQTRHTDAHHIEHWARGGSTDLTNLVTLCRHHHRLLHEGGFTVAGPPGALVFVCPDGRRLAGVPRRRGDQACHALTHVSAETVIQPIYDPMNLGYAVDALLTLAPIEDHASP